MRVNRILNRILLGIIILLFIFILAGVAILIWKDVPGIVFAFNNLKNRLTGEESVSYISEQAEPYYSALSEEGDSVIPHLSNKYLLNQLPEPQKNCAAVMYKSILNHDESCSIGNFGLNEDQLRTAYSFLYYDCPELFQVTNGYTQLSRNGTIIEISFDYILDVNRYQIFREEAEETIASLKKETEGLDDLKKEFYVVRYLRDHNVYDSVSPLCGTPYAALRLGYGKCDAFARAFQWVMQEMGIPCLHIDGPGSDNTAAHAWNIVRIGKNFYELDVTSLVCEPGEEKSDELFSINIPGSWLREAYSAYDIFETFAPLPDTENFASGHRLENGFLYKNCELEAIASDTGEVFTEAYRSGGTYCIQFTNKAAYEIFKENEGKYISMMTDLFKTGIKYTVTSYDTFNFVEFSISKS